MRNDTRAGDRRRGGRAGRTRSRPRFEVLEGRALLAALTIVQENLLPGSPQAEWDVVRDGDPRLQGFADGLSVNRGQVVSFKVDDADSSPYHIDIYRLGYYGGLGARKVAAIPSSQTLRLHQAAPLNDPATGLYDCGNWLVSATWAVPSDATSGVYIARLVRDVDAKASHVVFVVRADGGRSDLVFQTADETWQAYNNYGGKSLYYSFTGDNRRATKVSYNRPFSTAVAEPVSWVFNDEYPMIRWLEANGYEVSYTTGLDVDRLGSAQLLGHRAYLSVGHDEYWSGGQRAAVEAARDAGVSLAFFSGNEVFWKTRWENSIDAAGTPHRTMVCYKETTAGVPPDPSTTERTSTWRDPNYNRPGDVARPENGLTGTLYTVNGHRADAITVPAADGRMRFWRNTSAAALAPGAVATLPTQTLGHEWDEDIDNGYRPAGLFRLSTTTVDITDGQYLMNYGDWYTPGLATHSLTLYRKGNALVFGAGTMNWSWGLDSNHTPDSTTPTATNPPDPRMRQATVNLFADMGVQPGSIQAGLTPATASTDSVGPTALIASPLTGATLQGSPIVVAGTAVDGGGGVVGGVEVSVDGGATWHPAVGREAWSYSWIPGTIGTKTILARAVDDSGNLGPASAGVTVDVAQRTGPASIWTDGVVPRDVSHNDTGAYELGVQFRADVAGSVTGVRFYKGGFNVGTHVGHLWTSTGTLLATATFIAETATGWQTVLFPTPVAIAANTTYVASYSVSVGRYSLNGTYFTAPFDDPPLHALAGVSSPTPGQFPSATFRQSNFWADVVFDATPAAPGRPALQPASDSGVSQADGLTNVRAPTFDVAGAEAAATVQLLRDGVVVATRIGPGAVQDPGPVADGAHTYSTRQVDAAANVSPASAGLQVTVDTVAPAVPGVPDLQAASDSGASATDNVTSATRPTFDVAGAEATATVQLLRDGVVVATRIGPGAVQDPGPVADGAHTYSTRQVDAAGNASPVGSALAVTIDATAPVVVAETPGDGATGVDQQASITATFDDAMDAATINGNTVQLLTAANVLVEATVTYDAATKTVRINPKRALARSTTYRVVINGGPNGVKNRAGLALVADVTWSFTTR